MAPKMGYLLSVFMSTEILSPLVGYDDTKGPDGKEAARRAVAWNNSAKKPIAADSAAQP